MMGMAGNYGNAREEYQHKSDDFKRNTGACARQNQNTKRTSRLIITPLLHMHASLVASVAPADLTIMKVLQME